MKAFRHASSIYNTRQKYWDTLQILNLDGTFGPLLPQNNVGF